MVLSFRELTSTLITTVGFLARKSLPTPSPPYGLALPVGSSPWHVAGGQGMGCAALWVGQGWAAWLGVQEEDTYHQGQDTRHTLSPGCCGCLSLVTSSCASLVLACFRLAQPMCHSMQAILFPVSGRFLTSESFQFCYWRAPADFLLHACSS